MANGEETGRGKRGKKGKGGIGRLEMYRKEKNTGANALYERKILTGESMDEDV